MQKEMLLRQPTDQHDMRFPVILSEPCHPEEFFTTKDLSIALWVNAKGDASPSADGRVSLLTDQHDTRSPVIQTNRVILRSFSRRRISLSHWG
jgi:hypothetical protein